MIHCRHIAILHLVAILFAASNFSILAATVHNPLVEESNQLNRADQEYYELRIYQIDSAENQKTALHFLEQVQIPALKSLGVDRIGVFTVRNDDTKDKDGDQGSVELKTDYSIFMITPFKDLEKYSKAQTELAAKIQDQMKGGDDKSEAAKSHLIRPLKKPVYSRIEVRLLKAFASIPVLEKPDYSSDRSDQVFELRLYESHTEEFARRKVKMFNDGETELMRKVKLAPVFFGETLVGPDVPNLIYMLSAENMKAHQDHWKDFIASPEWNHMKDLEEYKDTVSKIRNWFLVPASFSDY